MPHPLASSSGSINKIEFTDNGNAYVISKSCGYDLCYETFVYAGGNAGSLPVTSYTEPIGSIGDGPNDYVLSATTGGNLGISLSVTDLATGQVTLIYKSLFGDATVDSYGDVAFIAYDFFTPIGTEGDTNVVYVNETTHAAAAVTPEPSSFMLLGTGLLGVGGMLRRRLT